MGRVFEQFLAVSGTIAETFYSIQGEGPTAGLPAVFIRLQGCSVGCAWCDTKYSWDPAGGRPADVGALVAEAGRHGCRRVVVTGGEPLESPLFEPLVNALIEGDFTVEVETSGVRPPPAGLRPFSAGFRPPGPAPSEGAGRAGTVQWNVSLKLPSSGVPEGRRINSDAIAAFVSLDSWWKFVVEDERDVTEVLALIDRFYLPADRVLLQPQAARPEELQQRGPWVVEQCKRHGFRFSPRLHIWLWGPKRGV